VTDYFDRKAAMIEGGETVTCQFCPTPLTVRQLREQYEMCDQHYEAFCRGRWPERYTNAGADPRGDMRWPEAGGSA